MLPLLLYNNYDMNESKPASKAEILGYVKDCYVFPDFNLVDVDEQKPWGAYYTVNPYQIGEFVSRFFPESFGENLLKQAESGLLLYPKILAFEPGQQLSGQYHGWRAEHWAVLQGVLHMATSLSDSIETDLEKMRKISPNDGVVSFGSGVSHIAGAGRNGGWCVVAEIWEHTDPSRPSDEGDIVRIYDKYGRK